MSAYCLKHGEACIYGRCVGCLDENDALIAALRATVEAREKDVLTRDRIIDLLASKIVALKFVIKRGGDNV